MDSHKRGPTGVTFDWALVARADLPDDVAYGIAGGLAPDNVADAIAHFAPDFVDVSSGVETRVGEKSEELMRAFVAESEAAHGDALTRAWRHIPVRQLA